MDIKYLGDGLKMLPFLKGLKLDLFENMIGKNIENIKYLGRIFKNI